MILGIGLALRGVLSVGLTLLSYFLRPSQNVERGRVGQIPLQQSEFGQMIPIAFGTVRTAGNVIWSTDLREVSETQREGGKGLMPSQKVTSFRYFIDFAALLTKSKVVSVPRIWGDGKLIYDQTGASDQVAVPDLVFRLYDGSEDQEPDSLIVADIDAKHGTGSTPAFRGRSYIVFENFDLTNFGNRIPNLTFEIVIDSDSEGVGTPAVTVQDGALVSGENTGQTDTSVDWDRGLLLMGGSNTVGGDPNDTQIGLLGSLAFMRTVDRRQADGGSAVDPATGYAVSKVAASGNTGLWDPVSGSLIVSKAIGIGTFEAKKNYCYNAGATPYTTVFIGIDRTTVGLNEFRYTIITPDITTGSPADVIVQTQRPDSSYSLIAPTASKDGTSYAGFISASELQLYGLGVSPSNASFSALGAVTIPGNTQTINWGILDTLTPADFGGASFTAPGSTSIAYDRSSGDAIIFLQLDNTNYAARYTPGAGLGWISEIPYLPGDTNAMHARITGRVFGFLNTGGLLCLLDITSGNIDPLYNGENVVTDLPVGGVGFGGAVNHFIWDEQTFSFFGTPDGVGANDTRVRRIRLTSPSAGSGAAITLADIVHDLCVESGYESIEDIDVGELITSTVPGYLIERQMPVRRMLEPLADAYMFDGVESDYKMVFRTRGRAVSKTMTEDDLLRVRGEGSSEGRTFTKTRVQESEIPASVAMTFFDADNDYQKATVETQRVQFPAKAVKSENKQTIDIPAVLEVDFAEQAAEKTLFTRWNERNGFEFRTHWEFLALDPSDVLQMTFDSGLVSRIRLEEIDLGADLTLEFRGVQEGEGQYVSTASGQAGAALQVTIPVVLQSQFFLLDVPLLQDTDSPPTGTYRMYWAGNFLTGDAWTGGIAQESEDLIVFENVDALSIGVPWGYLTTALGTPSSPFRTDNENTITLSVVSGKDQFSTATKLQVLNGANAIAVLREDSDFEVEIVQFTTVTENADGTITLSELLRGRRGTEVFADQSFPAGTKVILLSTSYVGSWVDAASEAGSARKYRLVTLTQDPEDATIVNHTAKGRSARPYAPAQRKAVLQPNGDIKLTAVRRTRINGELLDGVGAVPLNESSEAYELDILDGPNGNVIRAVTGLSTAEYDWTAAQQISDFGSIGPNGVTVRWYQISADVGRGFTTEQTLEVQ